MFGIIFKLLLSINASYSAADTACAKIDHRPKLGPIKNQQDIGWCYAYAASDMATYWTGQEISATDIAITQANKVYDYHLKDRKETFTMMGMPTFGGLWRYITTEEPLAVSEADGATIRGAIDSTMMKGGFCPNSSLPDYIEEAPTSVRKQYQQIEEMADSAKPICPRQMLTAQRMFPQASYSQIRQLAETSPRIDFLEKLADASCPQRIKPTRFPMNAKLLLPDEMQVGLGSHLLKVSLPNGPVALAVAMNSLVGDESIKAIDIHTPTKIKDVYQHALTVVGRERDQNGKCQYIVKNSWGKTCGYSLKGTDTCKDGYLYLSEETLKDITLGLNYFVQPKL